MGDNVNSYDYGTIRIDDVTPLFRSVVANRPVFISLVDIQGGVTNTKHEWLQFKQSPQSWLLDAAYTAAGGTITLVSNDGLAEGDILRFEASDGTSYDMQAKVTAVDAGGADIDITEISTSENLADETVVYRIASPKNENSGESDEDNSKPDRVFNYTQIFRKDIQLSRTTLQSALHGLATDAVDQRAEKVQSLVDFQVERRLVELSWDMNASMLFGIPEQRTSSNPGRMGGVLYYLAQQAGTQLDAAGAEVSLDLLNQAVEQAVSNGADGPMLTILFCHPTQARAISALNTTGNNPTILREDKTTGSYVAQFQSDLGGTNGGALTTIVVDRNFAKDKIVIIRPDAVKLKSMQNMFLEETTDKKTDGRTWKLLGEYTLEFNNYTADGIVISDVGIPA